MRKAIVALAAVTLILATGVGAQSSKAAVVALEAAIRVETVDGDLAAAIRQYQDIAAKFSTERQVAARALLRLAACYQKMGRAEARATLERIVKQYPEQQEVVQQARAQLGGDPAPSETARTRRVSVATGPETLNLSGILMGSVSRDGRFLCYTADDGGVSALAVRDLTRGTDRVIVKGDRNSHPDQSSISSDGRQVAFAWWNNDADRYELRVIPVTDKAAEPRVLVASKEIDWIEGLDWAPDDKAIVAQLHRADGTSAIGLVSTDTGNLRVLQSFDWRWTGRMFFSPDGKQIAYDFPESETNRNRDVFILAVDGSRKVGAALHGANDRAVGWSPDGTMLLFVSDRAGSDSLWGVPLAGGSQGTPVLLKRDFSSDVAKGVTASGALYYGVPHVSGFDLKVSTFNFQTQRFDSAPSGVLSQLIPTFGDFDWSPDGASIVYVARPGRMEDALVFHDLATGQVREIRTTVRGIGGPRFTPDGRHVIVRGLNEKKQGSLGLHRIDVKTGEAEMIVAVGGASQRVELSPDGERMYYRKYLPQNERSFVERTLRTGAERVLIEHRDVGNIFLSPDGRYVATGSLDVKFKKRFALLIPTGGGAPIETVQAAESDQLSILMWAPDSRSFFVRKVVGGKIEVWRVPVEGSSNLVDLDISQIEGPVRVSPDGKRVAYQVRAVTKPAELWVLENFLPTTVTKPSAARRR